MSPGRIAAMNPTLRNPLAVVMLTAALGAQASAPDAVVAAIGKARKDNMRVLLVNGDDGVRAQLSGALSRLIMYEFVKVEMTENDAYGQMFRPQGVDGAFLAILDSRYKSLATKAIAELPTPDDTKAFLETHQATPVDANAAYAKAIALADKTDRRVFVHLSAPW